MCFLKLVLHGSPNVEARECVPSREVGELQTPIGLPSRPALTVGTKISSVLPSVDPREKGGKATVPLYLQLLALWSMVGFALAMVLVGK